MNNTLPFKLLLLTLLFCTTILLAGCGSFLYAFVTEIDSIAESESLITEDTRGAEQETYVTQKSQNDDNDSEIIIPEYESENDTNNSITPEFSDHEEFGVPENMQNDEREFSERWKRAAYDRVRKLHYDLLLALPEKQERLGDFGREILTHGYSVTLYDAGFDAPYFIISDMTYEFMTELSTLHRFNGSEFQRILTTQWIEPLYNTRTGDRDLISATSHGGGTASHSDFYRLIFGEWKKESYWYATGGGQFFGDDATGEFVEGDEATRLLSERLSDHRYYEKLHNIQLQYIDNNSRTISWEQVAEEFSAFLDSYDGIDILLTSVT